jgi:hypothetical protein
MQFFVVFKPIECIEFGLDDLAASAASRSRHAKPAPMNRTKP